MLNILLWFRKGWKKIRAWFQHDRETKWMAIGFAVALWFYLLSENFAQSGYSWQRMWNRDQTTPVITNNQNLPRETIPISILEEKISSKMKPSEGRK